MSPITARVDYFKVRLYAPLGKAHEVNAAAVDAIQQATGTVQGTHGWHVFPDNSKTAPAGSYFIVDVPGHLADVVYKSFPYDMVSEIMRLDLRYETECDRETFSTWRAQFASARRGKFSVQMYQTQERTKKTAKRDQGGFGVAFGSTKADRRINYYWRSGNKLALEIRLSRKFAAPMTLLMKTLLREMRSDEFIGKAIKDLLTKNAEGFYQYIWGTSTAEFLRRLNETSRYDEASTRNGVRYEAVVADLVNMNAAEQEAVVRMLYHRSPWVIDRALAQVKAQEALVAATTVVDPQTGEVIPITRLVKDEEGQPSDDEHYDDSRYCAPDDWDGDYYEGEADDGDYYTQGNW